MAELARYTPRETIEFVYVPWGNERAANLGYAFAVFEARADALVVHQRAEGLRWSCPASSRLIRSAPSEAQGVAESLERFLRRSANQSAHPPAPPLMFEAGVLLSMELASRKCHVSEGVAHQPRHQLRAQHGADCVFEDVQTGGAVFDLQPLDRMTM